MGNEEKKLVIVYACFLLLEIEAREFPLYWGTSTARRREERVGGGGG